MTVFEEDYNDSGPASRQSCFFSQGANRSGLIVPVWKIVRSSGHELVIPRDQPMLTPTRDADPAAASGSRIRSRPFAPACFLSGDERELLLECLESQQWSSFRAGTPGPEINRLLGLSSEELAEYEALEARFVGGKYVRRLESLFARYTRTRFAISANSATSGLVMALGAIDLNPGDEVLVPCMSFHATATSVLFFNAVPIFTEVKPDTYCMDPADAEAKLTKNTKAIVVVHLGGNTADMDAIMALACKHSLKVIEDCAQAPGVTYKGRPVGSIGNAGVFSLTETKNITCGEGGLVVTDDPRIARKARLIRNHGEGVAEASWPDEELVNVVGMNFRLTELQAAVAIGQLSSLEQRNAVRRDNTSYLLEHTERFPQLVPPTAERGAGDVCYILKWRYRPRAGDPDRDTLVRAMRAEGIPLVDGYARLLHELPIFARRIAFGAHGAPFVPPYHDGKLCYGRGACPRSEEINNQFLWFTFVHPPNCRNDMDDVAKAFGKILQI
jgi:perosamine synthetase